MDCVSLYMLLITQDHFFHFVVVLGFFISPGLKALKSHVTLSDSD